MDNKTSKQRSNQPQNLAFTRPKTKKDNNKKLSLKDKFDPQLLEKNPWGQFLLFVEDVYVYKKSIRSIENQGNKPGEILKIAIKNLNETYQASWAEILNQIPQSYCQETDKFYYHISNRKKLTPQKVYQESQAAIKGLINNAEYGFIYSDNRDIGRIIQLCDAINYFHKNPSKTYLILSQLEAYVPGDAKPLFTESTVFQSIIEGGSQQRLTDFGMALMKHFRVTHTAIKDETAGNLILSMGEIERELKTQITTLEAEKLELTNELKQSRQQVRENALIEIAQDLQNSPQPGLHHIDKIISSLESQIKETGEAELSSDDAQTIFIILRNFMTILQKLGIESYPQSLQESFTISELELAKYTYVGTPFTKEKKKVKCIQKGWKVNDKVITPAKVKELIPSSEGN
ncbi:MAG: nucleotide exchange factor GrpE [Nostoc sp. RI_552]|nr:nucleotide exchange factor GrpE [Nostoc sp. RI_552]